VVVHCRFGRLDLPFELFILSFQLAVILDEFIELFADPVCVAGGAPGFLAAVIVEGIVVFLLLFSGERQGELRQYTTVTRVT
jgi:hypothetical protein